MSAAIYRLLLRLYPADFRLRWEEQLVDTFQLQLADGWFDAWRCVLAELLTTSREGLAIPVISLAGSCTLLYGLIWALGNSLTILRLYHHMLVKLGG